MAKSKNVSAVKEQIVNEIHRPARINFKRRRVIIKGYRELYQADLCELGPYAKDNNGFKYILVVIDCFSKFVWAYPLKTKTGQEVSLAMEKVFKEHSPKLLQTDQGTEFLSKPCQTLYKKYNVKHYHTYSEKKASIVERVIRTLKGMIWKQLNLNGTYKWYTLLPHVVLMYNNKKHRTIGMKPSEVGEKNEKHLLKTVYSYIKLTSQPTKFQVGQHVRISKTRSVFDKKYMANWSTEIFTVKKVQLTNPVTYILEDVDKQEIKGGFYEQQLQKVKFQDAYLVEKILKRNKNKVLVRWLGFSDKHNSWLDKNNVL